MAEKYTNAGKPETAISISELGRSWPFTADPNTNTSEAPSRMKSLAAFETASCSLLVIVDMFTVDPNRRPGRLLRRTLTRCRAATSTYTPQFLLSRPRLCRRDGSPEFETCPPGMDTGQQLAQIEIKTMSDPGFGHKANRVAEVRNVSRLASQIPRTLAAKLGRSPRQIYRSPKSSAWMVLTCSSSAGTSSVAVFHNSSISTAS